MVHFTCLTFCGRVSLTPRIALHPTPPLRFPSISLDSDAPLHTEVQVHRTTAAESLSEPSESDPGVAVHVHGRLADLDGNGSESLDVMVDENLPCTVAQVRIY